MGWTFLTNHAHILYAIAREPGIRLRDVADAAGITESAAHRIVVDLEREGYLTRHRLGLRNYYELHPHLPLRHELEREVEIGELLSILLRRPVAAASAAPNEEGVESGP
jgi:DNA-binding IclR family transcriptional regulator